jgi:serine palmitoyltransferase
MLLLAGKIPVVSRLCFSRNIAMVVVGFPATALLLTRARVCISAAHTRADLDYALRVGAAEEVEHVPILYLYQTWQT